MSFRDSHQQTRAIRALLASVRLERLWTFEGPTPEAVELLRAGGGHLSSSEVTFLRAAFDFWNGDGACTIGRLLNILDYERLESICALVLALSDARDPYGAVDRWLTRSERPSLRTVP